MTRINTNLSSLTAQNSLSRSSASLQISLTRLSTGLRINTGKDDPAGLIASEILRSEKVSIAQSIQNSERAVNIVATADAALAEVSRLLNDVRVLVQSAANKGAISDAEIAANQVQVDSSLESITRISQTTVFGGEKLLNGSKSFIVNVTGGSLAPFASSADINVKSFNPALHSATPGNDVSITVNAAATKKTVVLKATDNIVGNKTGFLDLSLGTSTRTTTTISGRDGTTGNSTSLNDLTAGAGHNRATATIVHTDGGAQGLDSLSVGGTSGFTITGEGGSAVISFANNSVNSTQGGDTQALVDLINAQTGTTGVVAKKVTPGSASSNITLESLRRGATATFSIGTFTGVAGGQAILGNVATITAVTAGAAGAAGTAVTFTITGDKGTASITINDRNTIISDSTVLRDAINARTATTGVTATLGANGVGGGGLGADVILSSSSVGSEALAGITITAADADETTFNNSKSLLTGNDADSNTTTVEIIGDLGRAVVTFSNDNVIKDSGALVTAINAVSTLTGVTASGSGHGGDVTLTSQRYGSRAAVSISAIAQSAAGNTDDIATINAASTQFVTEGTDTIGTLTHALGGGNFEADGEVVSFTDGSINLTGITDPSQAPSTRATTTIRGAASSGGGIGSLTGTGVQTISYLLTGYKGSVNINGVNVAALKADSRVLVDLINAQTAVTGVRASTTAVGGSFALSNIVLESDRVGGGGNPLSITATAASVNPGDITAFNDADTFLNTVAGANATTTAAFDVTGGALFQIGPSVNFANQVNINITSLDLSTLGRNFSITGSKALVNIKTGGTDTLNNNDLTDAASVVEQAIDQIATLRGELGALQKNVLESNINSLQSGLEQVTSAESSIRDADFAVETANLTRSQILVQAGTSVLAIANQIPQNVLALLQR